MPSMYLGCFPALLCVQLCFCRSIVCFLYFHSCWIVCCFQTLILISLKFYAMLCFGSFQVLVIHKDSSIPTVSGYIQQNLGCRVSCRTSLEVAFCHSGELFSDQIYIFEVVYFRQISEFAYKQSSCWCKRLWDICCLSFLPSEAHGLVMESEW